MKTNQKGFSVVEALLVVVVLGLIGGGGYILVQRSNAKTTTANTQTQPVAPVGTTSSIDSLTAQDQSNESSIDAAHATSDESTAQNANSAAANIGGAYDETNL